MPAGRKRLWICTKDSIKKKLIFQDVLPTELQNMWIGSVTDRIWREARAKPEDHIKKHCTICPEEKALKSERFPLSRPCECRPTGRVGSRTPRIGGRQRGKLCDEAYEILHELASIGDIIANPTNNHAAAPFKRRNQSTVKVRNLSQRASKLLQKLGRSLSSSSEGSFSRSSSDSLSSIATATPLNQSFSSSRQTPLSTPPLTPHSPATTTSARWNYGTMSMSTPSHRPSSGVLVDMAVMLSNPLVIYNEKGQPIPLHDRLDHESERKFLADSLGEAARCITVRYVPPTTDMLRVIISNGARILHFSGHGLTDGKSNDYLVFENGSGCAHLLNVPTLYEIVQASNQHSLELVFVASCHSRLIGQAFISAGVKFAVCVKRSERIMDESSIAFSRAFYHSLFTGHTVSEAFRIGRSRVKAAATVPNAEIESDKFVLLTQNNKTMTMKRNKSALVGMREDVNSCVECDQNCKAAATSTSSSNGSVDDSSMDMVSAHIRSRRLSGSSSASSSSSSSSSSIPLFSNYTEGSWRDATPIPSFALLPPPTSFFIGREKELYHVIQLLTHQRLVTVRGPPGIGKSSLAKAVAHFVLPRQLYKDGVLYVSLRGCRTPAAVLAALRLILSRHNVHIDCQKAAEGKEAEQKVLDQLRGRDVLLVLDNAEDPLHGDSREFRAMIRRILDVSRDLKLLVASRQALGNCEGLLDCAEKVYTLTPLQPVHAAILFMQWCPRDIDKEELQEGLGRGGGGGGEQGSNDRLKGGGANTEASSSSSSSSSSSLGGADTTLKNLSEHPILKFLNGHPHAITLAAPLLQDRSLLEVLALLQSKSSPRTATTQGGEDGVSPGYCSQGLAGIEEEEESVVKILEASLQVSVDEVAKTSPKTKEFFCLLGFLPGGAMPCDLESIWGNASWQTHVQILLKASLVTCTRPAKTIGGGGGTSTSGFGMILPKNNNKKRGLQQRLRQNVYSMFPFVCRFSQMLVQRNPNLRQWLLIRCQKYFGKVADRLFHNMGRGTRESIAVYAKVQFYKLNMWHCLKCSKEDDNGEKEEKKEEEETMMKPPLLIDTTTPVGRLASAFSSVLLLDGQIAASKRAAEEGLKAAKRAGDVLGEANLQKMLGVIVTQKRTRNIVAARERYVEAYSLYKSASCILGQAVSQAAIGYVFVKTESYAKARGCYQRALSQFRKAQHLEGQYNCHQWLGVIHRKLGHRNDLLANTLQKSKSLACFRAAQRVLSILKRTKRFVFKWHGNDLSLHMRYVLANNSRPTLPSSSSSSSSTSIKGKSKLGADGGGGGANNSCNNFLLSSGGSSHGSVSAGGGGGGNKKKKKKTTTTTTSTAGTMTNKGSSLGRRLLYERQRKESFSGLNQGSSSSSSGSNPTSGGGGAISAISRRHHNKRPPPTPTPRSDLSKT
eukprot:jgi/Bigna1/79144/fgenesh1_pg.60_\